MFSSWVISTDYGKEGNTPETPIYLFYTGKEDPFTPFSYYFSIVIPGVLGSFYSIQVSHTLKPEMSGSSDNTSPGLLVLPGLSAPKNFPPLSERNRKTLSGRVRYTKYTVTRSGPVRLHTGSPCHYPSSRPDSEYGLFGKKDPQIESFRE